MARRPNPTLRPTPLRRWREKHDISYREIAARAELAERTVLRAAAGKPVDEASAAALERVTGIAAAEFVAGARDRPAPPGKRPPARPGPTAGKSHTKSAREKARVLLEAEEDTDAVVAARHGIGVRTLERWRAELETDPDLARAWRQLRARIEDRFIGDAAHAFKAVARRIVELAADEADIRALTAAIEKLGEVLVSARGLPRATDEKDDDGQPSLDREGDAAAADREAARTEPIH
jgi:transcriptional regulator with XRE-family HTH domain